MWGHVGGTRAPEFENRFQLRYQYPLEMTLGDASVGEPVTITRVGGERPFRRRLMELGLLPGTRVEILRIAPLGDPLELKVRGCFLSIRRSEASTVDVSPQHAACAVQ